MPLEKQIGDAATALSQNQYVDALDGTYWVSGWEATLGDGDLEVDIAPGEGAINTGGVETTETQTVDFAGDPDADNPRKAVISVDDTETVQKTLGDPMPADPEGEVRERTIDPSPPTNAPGVVVAEVWIGAGVTALVGDDVRDRRVANKAVDIANAAGGVWEEDSNSPQTLTGGQGTYQISDGYDTVLVFASVTNGQNDNIDMQVGGITDDDFYEYWSYGGTETTDDRFSRIARTSGTDGNLGTFVLRKTANRVLLDNTHPDGSLTVNNGNVFIDTGSFNQFTLFFNSDEEITIQVFGK